MDHTDHHTVHHQPIHNHALGPIAPADAQRRFPGLTIDTLGRRVFVDDKEVVLTRLEFGLLMALTEKVGSVATPQELLESVWGYSWLGDDHVVETHVGRLRTKLGETGRRPRFIHTVRGVGYRFDSVIDIPHLHHVAYDATMTISAVEPADHGVLGWRCDELVGQSVVFNAPHQSIDQATALSIAKSLSRLGTHAGPSVMGAFDNDGAQHPISLLMCFMNSPEGEFQGLVAHLLLDGGQAAKDGRWPDGGHGSLCALAH